MTGPFLGGSQRSQRPPPFQTLESPMQPNPYVVVVDDPRETSSPFSLEEAKDDDATLFRDARTGFSHLLVGRPMLAVQRPHDPPVDAVIQLQDAPITIRYRLEPPSMSAASASDLARLTAIRFASWRAQAPMHVDLADETWLAAWGVEGAAVAAYDVSSSAVIGPPVSEDLFVLVREGMLYIVTWTYPRGFPDDPAWASFASVAEATMIWDSARWDQRGRVWPRSTFVGPGIYATPKAEYDETSRYLAQVSLDDNERVEVLHRLSTMVSAAGAPWVHLRPDVLDANRRALVSAFRDAQLRTFVDETFDEVTTAHDLRGLAIIFGRALELRPDRSLRANHA
jgi:hypothetical protein